MPVLYEKRNHVGWLTLSRRSAARDRGGMGIGSGLEL